MLRRYVDMEALFSPWSIGSWTWSSESPCCSWSSQTWHRGWKQTTSAHTIIEKHTKTDGDQAKTRTVWFSRIFTKTRHALHRSHCLGCRNMLSDMCAIGHQSFSGHICSTANPAAQHKNRTCTPTRWRFLRAHRRLCCREKSCSTAGKHWNADSC